MMRSRSGRWLWVIAVASLAACDPAPPKPAPEAPGVGETAAPSPLPSAPEASAAPEAPRAESPPAADATASPTSSAASKRADRPEKQAPPSSPSTTAVASSPPAATASAPAAPTATAEPEPKQVMSPKVAEGSYNLWMQSAGRAKVGQTSYVEVVLVAKGDYHCNDKYPYKLKLGAPPAGVTFPQPIVREISITPGKSVMRVPFVAAAAGDTQVGGTFYFSVCTAKDCKIDSRAVAITVKVEG